MIKKLYWLSLFGCLLFSCQRATDHQLKHDFGKIKRHGSGILWQETTRDQYKALNLGEGKPIYPADHGISKRLQHWADAIHDEVLKIDPQLVVPKPQTIVLEDSEANAFVHSVSVCVDVTINIEQGTGQKHDGLLDFYDISNYTLDPMNQQIDDCIKKEANEPLVQGVFDTFFSEASNCYTINKSMSPLEVNLDFRCLNAKDQVEFSSYKTIKRVKYISTSNMITFHDKVFDLPKEELVVALLAHELAHYYKSHGVYDENDYGFFYKLDEHKNLNRRPTPLPESDILVKLGRKTILTQKDRIPLYKVKGRNYNSLIFGMIINGINLFRDFCDPQELCHKSCFDLYNHFRTNNNLPALLALFPDGTDLPNNDDSHKFYKEFETKAKACFSDVPILPKYHDDILKLLDGMAIKEVRTKVKMDQHKTLEKLMSWVNDRIPEWREDQNKLIDDILREANEKRLGYYTHEQEADEIMLELIARIGINTDNGIELSINLLEMREKYDHRELLPGELNSQQCQKAYNNRFVDFIPISDYQDLHHSSCFRAYSVFREIEAHKDQLRKISNSP